MTKRLAIAFVITLAATPLAAQATSPQSNAAERDAAAQEAADAKRAAKALTLGIDRQMIAEAKRLADSPLVTGAKALAADAAVVADKALATVHVQLAEMDAVLAKVSTAHRAFDFQDRVRDRDAEMREQERTREASLYSEGQDAADEYRWDRALTYFSRVIDLKGSRLDAALYWKAYSQNRLGQRAEALTTIAELSKSHPNSPYRKQATVLEAEVRRDVGQPVRPQDSADDEVKLMALQALQNTAPEEAIPMIEKVLEGTSGRRVKQRALFVLAQSQSPRAREVLRNYARGGSTPDLQNQAIQYLGVHGSPESRAVLAEVYGTTTDVDVKRRILRAFMVSGEKDRLLKAAQGEANPELRAEAVGQLGNMQAHEELWQLYQKESAVDVKRRILRAMQVGGSVDRLIELVKVEQNPELRREVIRALGLTRAARTGDVLAQIYTSDSNPEVRKAVVNALFLQENATALVALARKEQDISMKKEIVARLSQMRSKIATDYMIELLGK